MKAKTMKRKRWMGLLLSVLMLTGLAASMTMQVSAAGVTDAINDKASSVITDALKPYLDQIDMTKKGSLELTLTKFSDGEVSIYPIMTEDGYLYDTKTGKASDNLASLISRTRAWQRRWPPSSKTRDPILIRRPLPRSCRS